MPGDAGRLLLLWHVRIAFFPHYRLGRATFVVPNLVKLAVARCCRCRGCFWLELFVYLGVHIVFLPVPCVYILFPLLLAYSGGQFVLPTCADSAPGMVLGHVFSLCHCVGLQCGHIPGARV